MKFFLDTNICIFILKGKFAAIKQHMLQYAPHQFAIPAIVRAELLLGGLRSNNPQKAADSIGELIEPFVVVPFCGDCATKHAEVRNSLERSGKSIGPHDLLIAATVLVHDGVLITHNIAEFKRVSGLRCADWTNSSE